MRLIRRWLLYSAKRSRKIRNSLASSCFSSRCPWPEELPVTPRTLPPNSSTYCNKKRRRKSSDLSSSVSRAKSWRGRGFFGCSLSAAAAVKARATKAWRRGWMNPTCISHLSQTKQIKLLMWYNKSSNKVRFINNKWCNSNQLHQRPLLPSIKVYFSSSSSNLTTQLLLQQRRTNSKDWSKRRRSWMGTKLQRTSGQIWTRCRLPCHSKTLQKTTINSTSKEPLSVSRLEQLAPTSMAGWMRACSMALTLTVHLSFLKHRWRQKTCLSTQANTLSSKKSFPVCNIKARVSLADSAEAQIKLSRSTPPLIRWLRTAGCNSKTLCKTPLTMAAGKAAPTRTRTVESVGFSRYPPTAASPRKESVERRTR